MIAGTPRASFGLALLPPYPDVTPDAGRIVRDGRLITGGGVTAGIDVALAVTAEVAGLEYAQTVQLAIEYAPAPPFQSGHPDTAPPAVLARMRARLDAMGEAREVAVRRAAAALAAG
jgi:transcriptional regulator GlxA family with amidase domain